MNISEKLLNFKSGNLLLSTKLENYEKLLVDIVGYFVNKNIAGVILSLNRSYSMLVKTFEANKIDTKNITFIDSITYNVEKKEGNCIYLSRPFNPTTASILITQLAQQESNKFFIFDSLTTLLLSYNVTNTVKFFQFILPKLASQNKLSLTLAIDADVNDKPTNLVIKLCDEFITV